ncbi:MAG: HD domain-containing protein, partial [Bacteroidota bacterium]
MENRFLEGKNEIFSLQKPVFHLSAFTMLMESSIVKKAEAYIKELLQAGLTADHHYHNVAHTLDTRSTAVQIGRRYRLTDEELELLELAALFHDTGFTKAYVGHEDVSKEIAAEFLRGENFPEEKIATVNDLIEVTKVTVEPQTMLQKILKDADFNTNGGNYQAKSAALRHEWKVFTGKEYDDRAWLESNISFWEAHRFYTGEGLAMFGEEKRKTLKKWNKEAEGQDEKKKKDKDKDKDKAPGKELEFAINSSKSAQMMFKTTLRNHVDLTNI